MWMYQIQGDRETDPGIKHWAVVEAGGGGMCPVQYWGTFSNGWRFYFRFRSNGARLNVAPPGTDMANVPLVNTDWSLAGAEAAVARGEDPMSPWWGPVGHVCEVYPHEPLAGFFKTEEDLQETFATCFEQVREEIGLGEHGLPEVQRTEA